MTEPPLVDYEMTLQIFFTKNDINCYRNIVLSHYYNYIVA